MSHSPPSNPNRTINYTNQDSETTMSTYNDGYRKGVEDATQPLYPEPHNGFVTGREANNTLGARRKSLLTKKVTKWVILLNKPDPDEDAYIEHGRLWDSESAAKRYVELMYGSKAIGVFPIEVEIPL